MRVSVTFKEQDKRIAVNFGEVQTASDGGYERGYADGYADASAATQAKPIRCLVRNGIGCIDTGVSGANSNLTIKMRYEVATFPANYWNLIYAYINEDTDATRITLNGSTYAYVCLNSSPRKSLNSAQRRYAGVVYTEIVAPGTGTTFSYTTNGVKATATRSSGSPLGDKNILLFANSASSDGVSLKLYYLKIYDGANLVRDYAPWVTEEGEYGLYDKVTEQFYGNIAGGAFDGEVD